MKMSNIPQVVYSPSPQTHWGNQPRSFFYPPPCARRTMSKSCARSVTFPTRIDVHGSRQSRRTGGKAIGVATDVGRSVQKVGALMPTKPTYAGRRAGRAARCAPSITPVLCPSSPRGPLIHKWADRLRQYQRDFYMTRCDLASRASHQRQNRSFLTTSASVFGRSKCCASSPPGNGLLRHQGSCAPR